MVKCRVFIAITLSIVQFTANSQKVITITRYQPVAIGKVYLKNKNKENVTYIVRGFNPFGSKLNGKGASIEIPAYKTPDIFSDITAKALASKPADTTEKDKIKPATLSTEKPNLIEEQKDKFITCYSDFVTNLQTINSLSRMEESND